MPNYLYPGRPPHLIFEHLFKHWNQPNDSGGVQTLTASVSLWINNYQSAASTVFPNDDGAIMMPRAFVPFPCSSKALQPLWQSLFPCQPHLPSVCLQLHRTINTKKADYGFHSHHTCIDFGCRLMWWKMIMYGVSDRTSSIRGCVCLWRRCPFEALIEEPDSCSDRRIDRLINRRWYICFPLWSPFSLCLHSLDFPCSRTHTPGEYDRIRPAYCVKASG